MWLLYTLIASDITSGLLYFLLSLSFKKDEQLKCIYKKPLEAIQKDMFWLLFFFFLIKVVILNLTKYVLLS